MFAIAGGAAGTTAWMIVQPDTSLVVAVGANALLGGLYYLAGLVFG
jgi:Ni,Fe-hydrogenase III small subunit